MNRLALGGFVALLLAGLGLFWWQGRAEIEKAAPPPLPVAVADDGIPQSDPGAMIGPAPPEASRITREQQRFFRMDRDRDGRITRNEMLSTRTAGFRELDKDGNNLLTFEEWAVTTANKFKAADRDGNLELTPEEFETTKPKPAMKPACRC